MQLDYDVGFKCDARHGPDKSPLFEFSFELDVDAMDEVGQGHHAMFSFVVDFATGCAKQLTSSALPKVIAAAKIYPPYLEDGGGMGTEYVSKYSEETGSGDTIYECLSFEYSDPMDTAFLEYQDQIGGAFFKICVQVFDAIKNA
jgi:hypothetical protein